MTPTPSPGRRPQQYRRPDDLQRGPSAHRRMISSRPRGSVPTKNTLESRQDISSAWIGVSRIISRTLICPLRTRLPTATAFSPIPKQEE